MTLAFNLSTASRNAVVTIRLYVKGVQMSLFVFFSSFSACSILGKDLTLPAVPSSVANVIYVSLSPNCLMLEICITIEVPLFKRSFRAFLELDPCQFTFAIGFESLRYEYLLFNYDWGEYAMVALLMFN